MDFVPVGIFFTRVHVTTTAAEEKSKIFWWWSSITSNMLPDSCHMCWKRKWSIFHVIFDYWIYVGKSTKQMNRWHQAAFIILGYLWHNLFNQCTKDAPVLALSAFIWGTNREMHQFIHLCKTECTLLYLAYPLQSGTQKIQFDRLKSKEDGIALCSGLLTSFPFLANWPLLTLHLQAWSIKDHWKDILSSK